MRHAALLTLILSATAIAMASPARAAIVSTGTVAPDPSGGSVNGVLAVGNAAGGGGLLVNGGSVLSTSQLSLATVAGGQATVTIDGAGSFVNVVRSNTILPSAYRSNLLLMSSSTSTQNPIAGATAQLDILNGGRLKLDGSVQPTALFGINIGLSGGAGSMGTLNIAGAGSQLEMTGGIGFLNVGHGPGHSGALNISGGGTLQGSSEGGLTSSTIGRAGGTGALSLSDPGSLLRLAGANTFLYLGRYESGAGSSGSATLSNGASLVLDGSSASSLAQPAMLIVGAGPGSTGTLQLDGSTVLVKGGGHANGGAQLLLGQSGAAGLMTLSGGASLTLAAEGGGSSLLSVGRSGPGTGELRLSGAGTRVDLASGEQRLLSVGAPESSGLVVIGAGARIDAGSVGIAATGGMGEVRVDGTLSAGRVDIGAGGLLEGSGVIDAPVLVNAGVINPGNSPGRLVINGALDSSAGEIVLEIGSDGLGGWLIDELVLSPSSAASFVAPHKLTLSFLGQADPNAIAAAMGGIDLDDFLRVGDGSASSGLSASFGAGQSWESLLGATTVQASSAAYAISNVSVGADGGIAFQAAPVPEPAPWQLLLLGGALTAWAMRPRRQAWPAPGSPAPGPRPSGRHA